MAGREPVEVTVEADGREIAAGTLWIHERGGQSATFRYAASYLEDPGSYDLDPALPKSAGVFHTPPAAALFGAFADSAPDRWGENLMRREERERARAASATPRTLGKADFLLGVRDAHRQHRRSSTQPRFPAGAARMGVVSGLRSEPEPGQSSAVDHVDRPRRRQCQHRPRSCRVRSLSPLPGRRA